MSEIIIQSLVGGSWSIDIGKDGENKNVSILPGVQTIKESEYKAIKDEPGFAARLKKGQFVILNKKEVDKESTAAEKAKLEKQKASKEVEELKDSHKKEIKKLKEKFNSDNLHLSNVKAESDADIAKLKKELDKVGAENAELKKLLDEATK